MTVEAGPGPLERMGPQFADLAELSLDALPGMFDSERGLFSHKTTVRDGRFVNREPNVLYSAVSLVGILRQGRRPADQVLPLGRALDGLHAATAERSRPGEIANFVWAATIAEDERGAEMTRRLAAVDPASCPSGELGQVLYGLVCGARAYAAERDRATAAAEAAAAELLERFAPRAEVFATSPRARRLPRRELFEAGMASFAAQVYPLHGLAAHYLYTGETPAPALARVAERIVDAQGPLGQWRWIYSSRARVVLEGYPVYSVHQDGMAFLGLVELERLGIGSFLEPLALGLNWIFTDNELGTTLVRREPPLVYRCIQRVGSVADGSYGVSRRNLWRILCRSLAPRVAGDVTDADAVELEILEECRSYHLGWLLYADSLIQEAEARRDAAVAERRGTEPPRRRLAVVSLHAHRPLAPRGERTRHLLERLERDWEVELVAPPPTVATGGAAGSGGSNPARRLAARAVGLALLDKWEPWSLKRLRGWKPEADAALLIGHPYSPLVHASRRLRSAAVPYLVDVGDPWVLTSHATELAGLARARAARAERQLWRGAAGAILTTPGQAARIEGVAPGIRTLVRPNGYDPVGEIPAPPDRRGDPVLRLAHFGMFNSVRLDPRPLLRRLAASGRWRRVVFSQYGDDFVGFLDDPPPGVEIDRNRAYPWEQVLERAIEHDLALVVGNVNPAQLPSKAVQYLTLPIPRLALSAGGSDALAAYVADKPGWLTVGPDQEDAAAAVFAHLAELWTAAALAPPASEAWPAVAGTIAEFLAGCVEAGSPQ